MKTGVKIGALTYEQWKGLQEAGDTFKMDGT